MLGIGSQHRMNVLAALPWLSGGELYPSYLYQVCVSKSVAVLASHLIFG